MVHRRFLLPSITEVELALRMELILNLGWAVLAAWMLCSWARLGPRTDSNRRAQFVALALVILILLPAISITDDLIAAQNPAEVDTCVRRDHDFSSPHSILPAAAGLPLPAFAGLSFAFVRMAAPSNPSEPFFDHPGLAPIQNRPPPAA